MDYDFMQSSSHFKENLDPYLYGIQLYTGSHNICWRPKSLKFTAYFSAKHYWYLGTCPAITSVVSAGNLSTNVQLCIDCRLLFFFKGPITEIFKVTDITLLHTVCIWPWACIRRPRPTNVSDHAIILLTGATKVLQTCTTGYALWTKLKSDFQHQYYSWYL